MTEADLRALGVVRVPIPVPFPQAGGPANAYLLEEADGGLLLFDAGIGSPEGVAALDEGFARAGRRFDEVRRIVLSHGHVDHYGAAMHVRERAGRAVPVLAHAADVGKVEACGQAWRELFPRYADHLVRLGVPQAVLPEIGEEVGGGFTLARRIPGVEALAPGAVFRLRHLALEAHHMPGHTPGCVVLHDPERGLLLAGDHLLERVSPNPVLELGPGGEEGAFRPLVAYVDSVARLRRMPVELVLPGHGAPFGDAAGVVDRLLAYYEVRQRRLVAELAGGARTPFELARALFPAPRAGDLFLAVSETIAHLELLEGRGELTRAFDGAAYRFALAA